MPEVPPQNPQYMVLEKIRMLPGLLLLPSGHRELECGLSDDPRSGGGMTVPHYRPIKCGKNPFALAIWLGVWTPSGKLHGAFRISVGRLWISRRVEAE